MTPEQYKAELRRLGLAQGQAAEFLGVVRRTSVGYANGHRRIPDAVALLLPAIRRIRNGKRKRTVFFHRSRVLPYG